LPKNLLSRATGWLVSRRLPRPLRILSLTVFQKKYRLDMNAAEKPLEDYACIGDLFTRRLKPGLRPIGQPPVHPADAVLTGVQTVQSGQLWQIKGMSYSFEDCTRHKPNTFENAVSLTYYLCPTDYHRVHAPVTGTITGIVGIAGELWPVNARSRQAVPNLFARNERVVIEIQTTQGLVLVVLVGATNVGQMGLSFDLHFRSNIASGERRQNYSVPIAAGDELGVFHMGSTVLVFYPETYGANVDAIKKLEGPVRMGQSLRHCFR
jgi:phosphatidylserine decarboxylase